MSKFFDTSCISELLKGNLYYQKKKLTFTQMKLELNNNLKLLWNPKTHNWITHNKRNENKLHNLWSHLDYNNYMKIHLESIGTEPEAEPRLRIYLDDNGYIDIHYNDYDNENKHVIVYNLPYPNNIIAPYVVISDGWIDKIGSEYCPFNGVILCTNIQAVLNSEYIDQYDSFRYLLHYIELFLYSDQYISVYNYFNYNKNVLLNIFKFIYDNYLDDRYDIHIDSLKLLWSFCNQSYQLFNPENHHQNYQVSQIAFFSKIMMISINNCLHIPFDVNPNNIIEINTIDLIKLLFKSRKKKVIKKVSTLSEIIENNINNISEGDYLSIMNLLKEIYDL